MKKTCAERRKISIAERYEDQEVTLKNVNKLVDIGAPNLWGHFKDGA